jgi:hypothetical protein
MYMYTYMNVHMHMHGTTRGTVYIPACRQGPQRKKRSLTGLTGGTTKKKKVPDRTDRDHK